ncbi:uncharacterized protein BJ171DRAFT_513478 [Polychytrium aggregatum]|uniref:uncharacterized protein n=1 Tax=Polychytrium aggregatum TaxID=110093 RepID=UPI0022FDE119|nr:uncharacterized protein BJ171DRAFT_513478 [Polychytrium aggregatum]KAI9202587.1 hypothetical protein BJ171DRAFT_513478 [Polychytrium aggregatum]
MESWKDIIKKLVALVGRAYYSPKEVIVLDLLSNVHSMRDEELAKYLRISSVKDLHRLCGQLKAEGLIKVETRLEDPARPSTNSKGVPRKVTRSYYYIDHKSFVDVVKWRIYCIGKEIEREVQSQAANVSYACGENCGRQYPLIEALMLQRSDEGLFLCSVCEQPLTELLGNESSDGMSAKYTKFMHESKPIVELLKQTDTLTIPEYISVNATIENTPSSAIDPSLDTGRELDISRETGAPTGEIVIVFEDENDRSGQQAAEGHEDEITKTTAQYYRNLMMEPSPSSSLSRDGDGDGALKRPFASIDNADIGPSQSSAGSGPSLTRFDLGDDDDDDDDDEFVEG